ncbi:MAG: type II toxin-antitoxin system mRNA interferase toxin, RelE/StbE family [Candidatus Shapirobacteria bacterium]|nr:type II toxin-antitoxin system mRNA interferase toxin, RelE/StbE family [Candidatus Shapirobacteria bacterium]
MAEIVFGRQFHKYYNQRIYPSPKLTNRFNERLKIFCKNSAHPVLNDHPLHSKLSGCRSFSITKDIRVIYQIIDDNPVRFLNVGTHNQVYGK